MYRHVWPHMLALHATYLAPTNPFTLPRNFQLPSFHGPVDSPDNAPLHTVSGSAYYKCCSLGSHPKLIPKEGPENVHCNHLCRWT